MSSQFLSSIYDSPREQNQSYSLIVSKNREYIVSAYYHHCCRLLFPISVELWPIRNPLPVLEIICIKMQRKNWLSPKCPRSITEHRVPYSLGCAWEIAVSQCSRLCRNKNKTNGESPHPKLTLQMSALAWRLGGGAGVCAGEGIWSQNWDWILVSQIGGGTQLLAALLWFLGSNGSTRSRHCTWDRGEVEPRHFDVAHEHPCWLFNR